MITIKNHRNKEGRRYCVATAASFYLCKTIKFFRPLKIARFFPWVDLENIDLSDPKKTLLTFKGEVVEITFENVPSFMGPVLSALYRLFSNSFPFKTEFGSTNEFEFRQSSGCMIAFLYISFCKSMDLIPNEILFSNLLMIQSYPQVSIDFTQLKVDQKSLLPVLNSLKYINNISYLLITGNEIPGVLTYLINVVANNDNLTNFLIDGCDSLDNFPEFAATIASSSIRTLCFRGITFPTQCLCQLFNILPKSVIIALKFYRCQIDANIVKFMVDNPQLFTSLSILALNEVDIFSNNNVNNNNNGINNNVSNSNSSNISNNNNNGGMVLRAFFTFLMAAKISSIELVDDNIDIAEVFSLLDKLQLIPLIVINLAKNNFPNFPGSFNLPVTLTEMNLSRVRWTTKSLLGFMTHQRFKNQIKIDLSGITGNVSDLHISFYPTSVNNYRTIIWNNNIISANLFSFLSGYSELKRLLLNECNYEHGSGPEIANSMVLYLQRAKLKELSIRGAPGNPHAGLVNSIFAVIRAHQSLVAIDIADNAIGDVGVRNFLRVIEGNSSIAKIAFDGSVVGNGDHYIQVLNKLATMSQITAVIHPVRDIENLIRIGACDRAKIEEAWRNLAAAAAKHQKTTVENVAEKPQQMPSKNFAQWDLHITLPSVDQGDHWAKLKEQFSLKRITGISKLNFENEQANLIILDGE